MPLYVADYLADTGHLCAAEHGAYLLLIMHYWRRGSLPCEDKQLASIARMTIKEWLHSRDTISAFFDSEWRHKRIGAELQKAEAAFERRARAGSKGGNAKAMLHKNGSNATPMLGDSYKQTASNALAKR